MNAPTSPGNPAFPQQFVIPPGSNMPDGSTNTSGVAQTFVVLGMTTRQYLAAKILPTLLTWEDRECMTHHVALALDYADELLRQDAARL